VNVIARDVVHSCSLQAGALVAALTAMAGAAEEITE
jgi:hypothetical protein